MKLRESLLISRKWEKVLRIQVHPNSLAISSWWLFISRVLGTTTNLLSIPSDSNIVPTPSLWEKKCIKYSIPACPMTIEQPAISAEREGILPKTLIWKSSVSCSRSVGIYTLSPQPKLEKKRLRLNTYHIEHVIQKIPSASINHKISHCRPL